jgi:O-antigen/teichoic acid export membrane protein
VSPTELRRQEALWVAPHVAVQAAPAGQGLFMSLDMKAIPESHGLSLRSNFAWVLTGNAVYAACQWGMIIALAKLGNSFMVGQFSLGLAIATPVLMFSNFDLRAVQATDARRHYRFAEYLRLRIVLTFAALMAIAGIVWFGRYESRTAAVILAIALAKGVETLSDIHYGLFQLNDRLDQTGRSMMLRGVLSVAALSAGLHMTHEVVWGCVWLALAWMGTLLLFDVRRGRRLLAQTEMPRLTAQPSGLERQWRLLYLAMPLGIVTTIASINLHMPRYFIHAQLGEHQLGIFSAMAYATVALTLVGDSLGSCTIPRMSRLYAAGKDAEFRTLLLKILLAGSVIGLSGLVVAWGIGGWLLTVFYSPEYAAHSHVFVLLMVAAAIHFAASMLTSGITSTGCFRIQVPMFALVAACTALICARWVPTMGLAGGALAVIGGASTRLVLAASVMGYLLVAPHYPGPDWKSRV